MANLDSENIEGEEKREESQGIVAVFVSVVAAFVGVQSSRRARRDFRAGKLWHYVLVGIVLTILFVLTLVTVVRLVI